MATGGTFEVICTTKPDPQRYDSHSTAPVNHNATASDVQMALADLSSVGVGNVTCTGGLSPNPIYYTFSDSSNPYHFNNGIKLQVSSDQNTNTLASTNPVPAVGQKVHVTFQAHPLSHPSAHRLKWSQVRKWTCHVAVYSSKLGIKSQG